MKTTPCTAVQKEQQGATFRIRDAFLTFFFIFANIDFLGGSRFLSRPIFFKKKPDFLTWGVHTFLIPMSATEEKNKCHKSSISHSFILQGFIWWQNIYCSQFSTFKIELLTYLEAISRRTPYVFCNVNCQCKLKFTDQFWR